MLVTDRPPESTLRNALLGTTALALFGIAMPAHAQVQTTADTPAEAADSATTDSANESDIIVTARRRAERLFDVPVAVSALSAQDIQRYSSNNLMKVAELTPGLNIGARTAGGGGAGITIRGVGTDGSNVGIPQSVALSIDGVMVSRGRALWSSYFDLQQVEVMKGPQALFFGKNSPAGVVALTSKGPTEELSAELQTGYEMRADELIVDGAVSGPLGGGLGARLAFRVRDMKGYMRNDARPLATGAPAPYDLLPGADPRAGEKEYVGRFTLAYDDGGPFTFTLKTMFDKYKDDSAVYPLELVHCDPGFFPDFNSLFGIPHSEPVGNCTPNWRTASSNPPREVAATMLHGLKRNGDQYSDVRTWISSLVMNYDLADDISLVSTTGYYYMRSVNLMNNDWTSFSTINGSEYERYRQFTQELRLLSNFDGPLNFMIGAFYEKSRTYFDGSVKFDDLPADPATGKFQTLDKLNKERGTAYSVFGQITYDITPEIELSGGARYSHDKKRGFVSATYSHPAVAAVFPVRSVPAGDTSDNVSPEVTVTYRPSTDLTVYAAYKTGYKAGGINLSTILSAAIRPEDTSFGKEEAKGFEAGIKARVLDGRGSIQLTAYRYKFTGLQVSAYVPDLRAYLVRNAAASRSTGVELEANYRVSDQLSLHSSLAYNRSRYLSFPGAACYAGQPVGPAGTPGVCIDTDGDGVGEGQDLEGRPTLTAPDWVLTGGFDFRQPIAGDYEIGLSGDAFYSSDYYFIQTQSPFAKQKDFVRFNAALRFYPTDERWSLALIGRNLTNKKVLVSGQDTPLAGSAGNPGALNGTLARPREVLVQVGFKF